MRQVDRLKRVVRKIRHRDSGPDEGVMKFLEPHFDRKFYLERYPDVAAAGVDPLVHFCTDGWSEGRDPCASFSTKFYVENSDTYRPELGNPFEHYLRELDRGGLAHRPRGDDEWAKFKFTGNVIDAFGHDDDAQVFVRYPLSRKADVDLIAANMDEEFYLNEYPEVKQTGLTPAVHYLFFGWIKGYDPSPKFSSRYYLTHNRDVRLAGANPYLHYLNHGKKESWRAVADRRSAEVLARFEDEAVLKSAVDYAVGLDPMVALPDQRRKVTDPFHCKATRAAAKKLRKRFAGRSFDHVVIVPHVRMSGAAKIGGHFAHAVAELVGNEKTLVVLSDLSVFEHPEWFPDNVEILDFPQLVSNVKDEKEKQLLIYDLFRGIRAKSITNVNSRLAWNMFKQYGKQLSQEFELNCYLFCWEETKSGARVGYPIQWLRESIGYLSYVFCDSAYLADYVKRQFALSDDSVIAALTPIDPSAVEAANAPASDGPAPTVAGARTRILWSGRFDRQKRLDVLLALARRNTDWEFIVYGKPVLREKQIDALIDELGTLENVRMMGAYDHVSEVMRHQSDLFLYTSQYDGIPTVLLEIGLLGIPIVAPDVGGVSELIDNETGWLIDDCNDVDAYEDAITQILTKRDDRKGRAERLKDRLQANHSVGTYIRTLKDAFERGR